jgi:hypothetical protein
MTAFGQRMAARSVNAFNCPNCGGPIALRAGGISVNAVCGQCSAVIDAADPNLRVIQGAEANSIFPDIPIGSRGELGGIQWEMIGYVRKTVSGTVYDWEEYLLFNPWHGFRFLSNTGGHWTFFKRLNQAIDGIGRRNALRFEGQTYKVFNKDNARVVAVQGEFYWRVKRDDETWCADYICPPYMLSSEEKGDEINITQGVYLDHRVVQNAFPEAHLRAPSGVGACQPSPDNGRARTVVSLGIAAAVAAIMIHMGIALALPDERVLSVTGEPLQAKATSVQSQTAYATGSWGQPGVLPSQVLPPQFEQEGETLVTPAFVLPEPSNLRISTTTGLDNSWAELDLTLVNQTTGVSYPVRQAMEHYSGVDGGERWSEGDNQSKTFMHPLPAGTYHMLVDGTSDALARNGALAFDLEVRRGVTDLNNLWLALALIAVYPIITLFRRQMFEQSRWSSSDYSPYRSSEDDE